MTLYPSSLNESAFRELVCQTISHAWGGKTLLKDDVILATDVSTPAPESMRGAWQFIPVPGKVEPEGRNDLLRWAGNLVLRTIENLGAERPKDYRGPGLVICPASRRLASSLETEIAGLEADLRSRHAVAASVRIHVLSPDLLETAAHDVVRIRRAFQAASFAREGTRSLAESPVENIGRGVQIALSTSARQLLPSAHISLTQAGGLGDEPARLSSIFFDPEAGPWPAGAINSNEVPLCAMLVQRLDTPLLAHSVNGENVRLVLVGGPGQGKSTVFQFLAQLYRASFVHPEAGNSAEVRNACNATLARAREVGIPEPQFRRWPIHVSLANYAEHLAAHRSSPVSGTGADIDSTTREGLFSYILSRLHTPDGSALGAADVRAWLQEWPAVLLLDGMDETPPELRAAIREQIDDFEEVAAQMGADIPVLITSRPQGSVTDFPFERWDHFSLAELDEARSKEYARAVIALRHELDAETAADLIARIEAAIVSPLTKRLVRTPLQVTILILLFQEEVDAESRFQLFDGYYTVVYRREANKPGALGEFIRDHRPELEELHERAGFILHVRSEHGEASLSDDELGELLSGVLAGRGYSVDPVLAQRLRLAITDRLVLLVSPNQGTWHFEVRVLQEYFTARHWTSGQTFGIEQIEDLLRRTLPLQFWRTVWSLAAGRILSDRLMYRAILLAALSGADTADVIAISTHPASRIAVDLLLDSAAANRPADNRAFVKLALDNIQDASFESIAALSDVLSQLLVTDVLINQLLSDEVTRVGESWSLERVALTNLLRGIRVRSQNSRVRTQIDAWLRRLGNENDQVRLLSLSQEVSLDYILRTAIAGIEIPSPLQGGNGGRFGLHSDALGTGYVVEGGDDISPRLAAVLGTGTDLAEWLARTESQLRESNPRLAKQIRDGLAYWQGVRPLGVRVDSLGNVTR